MASMYTERYLDRTEHSPITPQTFLSQTLRGRAKVYSFKYYIALQRDLDRRLQDGSVIVVKSVRGSIAYQRRSIDCEV